jgi:hypothetical protein
MLGWARINTNQLWANELGQNLASIMGLAHYMAAGYMGLVEGIVT